MNPTQRACVALGALFGLLGVAAGSIGAHALKARLAPEMLAVFETGVRYHLFHALALLAVGILARDAESLALRVAGVAFAAGIVLFPGAVYAYAITGEKAFAGVAPYGGISLMIGWAALMVAALRAKRA